jgi:phosphoglycolate phosphatase
VRLVDALRAAAFDLDGTLVDSAPDIAASANAMLEALGHAPLPEPRIALLIGEGVERLVNGVLAACEGRAATPAALAAATELFRRHYAARLFDRSRVYPGVVEGLRALEARGIALCCVTNKHSAFALPLLEAAGLARFFAFACCADRVEQRKPAPDLLLAACKRLATRPDAMLYVGDSRTDIATARAARCLVAVVDYGYNRGLPLADGNPDWIIASVADIAELSAATTLANTDA